VLGTLGLPRFGVGYPRNGGAVLGRRLRLRAYAGFAAAEAATRRIRIR